MGSRHTKAVTSGREPKPTEYTDLAYIYLTPRTGVGQRLKLTTIDKRLAQLPLWPTMMLLPQIASSSDRVLPGDRKGQVAFARQLLPSTIVDRAVDALRDPSVVVMSSETVLNPAVRAIVLCQDTRADVRADDESLRRELGELLLAPRPASDVTPMQLLRSCMGRTEAII